VSVELYNTSTRCEQVGSYKDGRSAVGQPRHDGHSDSGTVLLYATRFAVSDLLYIICHLSHVSAVMSTAVERQTHMSH